MIVGQGPALELLINCMSKSMAGLSDPERPMTTAMFLGPTGVGKTETVAALADVIFGSRRAFTRVNCQEYSAHYNISKLLGSPPGYVGGEIRPLLAQENIDRHHRKALDMQRGMIAETNGNIFNNAPESDDFISIILFDEIEKAHPKLWNLLLGILEEGVVTLGNNEQVDFRKSIIIVTTNVGSRAMMDEFAQSSVGFKVSEDQKSTFKKVRAAAKREVYKKFPLEFINRFDELVYFEALSRASLFEILEIMVARIHHRSLICQAPFLMEITDRAKNHLLDIGTDAALGARPLRRTLEREVVTVIANHICSGEINKGDLVTVDFDGCALVFNINDASSHGVFSLDNLDDLGTAPLKGFQTTEGTSERIDYKDDVAVEEQEKAAGRTFAATEDDYDNDDDGRTIKRPRR